MLNEFTEHVQQFLYSNLGEGGNLLHENRSARIKLSNSNLLLLGGGGNLLHINCYTNY